SIVRYRLIGEDGQSVEFINYMQPIMLDGSRVFLAGVRRSGAEEFRYIRFPVDAKNSVDEFMDLRAATHDKELVGQAAKRFAAANTSDQLDAPMLVKAAEGELEAFVHEG